MKWTTASVVIVAILSMALLVVTGHAAFLSHMGLGALMLLVILAFLASM